VENVKKCSSALGKAFPDVNKDGTKSTQPGLVAAQNILKNEVFSEKNIRYAWPAVGIEAKFTDFVMGKSAICEIKSDDPISWSNVGG
jgi:sialic acid synthase SpsE